MQKYGKIIICIIENSRGMGNMIKKIVSKLKFNKFTIVMGVLFIMLVTVTLGNAFLRSTLSIIGDTTIKKNSWIIYFDDVEKSIDSVSSEKDAKIVDQAKTRIEFEATLSNPGDFYEFTVYTVNDGTIDAMVDSIEKSVLTEEQLKYLEFDVTYDNGDPIRRCDELNAGTRRWIKAVVKFKEGLSVDDYPTDDDVHLNLFFNINYVQKEDTCIPTPVKDQHILTIKPAGGTYNGRQADTRIYLEKNETYTILTPTRELYNFVDWEVKTPLTDGTYTISENVFTMGDEDVTIEATWEEVDAVARIMNTYYPTIQEAFDAAKHADFADNTVYLLRNTTEYPVNNTSDDFIFNLGGHTVTGTITNSASGNISLVNGRVEADTNDDAAFINFGNFNLGIDDGDVRVENSIALIGNSVGLVNKDGSTFYFYDGYIEGTSGIVGGYTDKAENYYVFADHNDVRNCQRVYLVRNPSRAVAKTSTQGDIYYYNLQDAFNSAKLNKENLIPDSDENFIVFAYRNFEAAYPLSIDEDAKTFFDTRGYTISTGGTFENDGWLKIYSSADTDGKIKSSVTIVNNGIMTIDDVDIQATTDVDVIRNNNNLTLGETTISSKNAYSIYNNTDAVISFSEDTVLDSTSNYALYNKSNNLVVDDGTIYGFYNVGNIVIDDTAKFRVYKIDNNHYIPAIKNSGTITMENGDISTDYDTTMIYNNGTFTINEGNISAYGTAVGNDFDYVSGTFNANGGLVSSQNYTISGGTINVNANGEIKSVNRTAINSSNVNIYAGDVYSDNDTAISCGGHTINIYGGLVQGENVGISGCTVNMEAGEVTGKNYGINTSYTLTISGGKVTSENKAASVGTANVSGGEISSANDALVATNLNMSAGKVYSSDANAITVLGTGTITGADTDIYGDFYGVLNKGNLTIGSFANTDEDDPLDYPAIVGGSYGLYIEGPVTNFYDGILKGKIDGYTGNITGLPLSSVIGYGDEEINGELYNTAFISRYENWLKVGDEEFNSIDKASKAISEGETGTITVIKDADIVFVQHFIDNGNEDDGYKNITFDLNGHTITSTQTIYNDSHVTIVDGDPAKTGTIKPTRVSGITNRNELIIAGGNYLSEVVDEVIYNETGTLTIDEAYFNVNKYAITNTANLIINDIEIEQAVDGINNRGNTTVHGGNIYGSDMGISSSYNYNVGSVYVDGGYIYGENYGIGGGGATITIAGGEVKSNANNALYAYYGDINVSGGKVTSENNVAVVTAQVTNISGGEVTGTKGIEHICYYSGWGSCAYHDINVSGGKIVGTDTVGIHAISAKLYINGGEISGETDGVYTTTLTQIGDDDENVSTTVPTITGKRYGLNTESYTQFFDGVLRGMDEPHVGLIGLIPDAHMIKNDYTYIDRDYYKTQYLVAVGNWLKVGNQEFNTLTKATAAIAEEGTIYVIADAYVDYLQELPSGKNITFDLNGHSIITTQPLQTKGTNTIKDSIGNGSITNIRSAGNASNYDTSAVHNTGTLTIEGGNFYADEDYAINNGGTLTIENLTIENYGGIFTDGTLTINGGYIKGTTIDSISSWGTTTINGGEIVSDVANNYYPVKIENGTTIINSGDITSTASTAVSVSKGSYYSLGHVVINGGNITGKTNGVINTTSDNTIRINGGNITGEENNGLNTTSHDCIITGGNIIGANYGVYTTGTTTLGVLDSNIDITQPLLQGDLYGLYIDGGTVNFYDGILKGITRAESGIITNIPDRAQIFEDSEVINGNTYNVKYLIMESVIAYNYNTGVEYTNLQDAIDEADTDELVILLNNVPLYYAVTNSNQKHFTLDLNGYTISTNKTITNTGNIEIVNNGSSEAQIKTSSAVNLINNSGTLSISDTKLVNLSSSNYVISSSNNIELTNVKINAINGVSNSGTATINNNTINATKIAINNSKDLTIDGGTYRGDTYSLYSYGSSNQYSVSVSNATLDGNIENIRTTLNVTQSNMIVGSNGSINNSAIATFNNVDISNTNGGSLSNSGTLNIINSDIDLDSPSVYNYSDTYVAIYNSGTLDIDSTDINVDKTTSYKTYTKGISNSGTLTINNETTINVGHNENNNRLYYGLETTGSGTTTINNSTINVQGGTTNYGVYMASTNAATTLETGRINVSDAPNTYGAYINPGTFIMGHYDNATTNVSQEDPVVYSAGTTRGIGVAKVNGSFKFYDGVIWASRFARQGTTTHVEKDQEVTTYVDEETSFERAWLEYIKNDYSGDTVALYNEVYYTSLQDAIDDYDSSIDDEIVLLKPIEVESLSVAANHEAKINLRGYSITTKITNNGTLDLYNGTIMNFNDYAIVNNGTFNMGQDDTTVSSVSIRIISEATAIENNGTFNMYDGYIEGENAINGEIDHIADLARVVTKHEEQSERKYLQSLSEEDIIAGNTDLYLTIDPTSGYYDGSKEVRVVFLKYQVPYELSTNLEKYACTFDHWEASENGVLEGNTIRMNLSDVTLTAVWTVNDDAVARIGEEYYKSVSEAIAAANEGDTVVLIKDHTENVTNNKNITLDLGGYTLTGEFINNGVLILLNGQIYNPNGIGLVNNKTLTMGRNDTEVQTNYVSIKGETIGLEQNGRFNFYDGYIEAIYTLSGNVDSLPRGFTFFTEPVPGTSYQRSFLNGNPANAVATISIGGENVQYFFNLQNAIDTANYFGKQINIIRDFEAGYEIEVKEDYNITINMNSYNITTGNLITNNGILTILDTSEDKGSISSASPIANNGTLTINNIQLKQLTNTNTITNNGTLTVNNSRIIAKNGYAVENNGTLNLTSDSSLEGDVYALYNNSEDAVIGAGTIQGVIVNKNVTLNNGVKISSVGSRAAVQFNTSNVTATIDDAEINGYNGLTCNYTGSKFVVSNSTINATNVGVRLETTSCQLDLEDSSITSVNEGIRMIGYDTRLNVTGSEITSTSGSGIYDDSWKSTWGTVNISGSTISGADYGMRVYDETVTITDTQITTTSTNRDRYALYCDYDNCTLTNSTLIANNASGLYVGYNPVTLNSTNITSGANLGRAIYQYAGTLTINGDSYIESTGLNGYGIYRYNDYDNATIIMNDGEIKAANVGIYMYSNPSRCSTTLNVLGGKIDGNIYGILSNSSTVTTKIGSIDDEETNTDPVVTGGLYGYYRKDGSVYLYNGRLRGYVFGYNDSLNGIRSAKDIAIDYEMPTESISYYTTDHSLDPVSNYAKEGNGHVNITYLGDTVEGVCEYGQVYPINYNGDEQIFDVPCTGNYKIEAWGAQGGSYSTSIYGGFGGYATGEIELQAGAMLFVNVGGQGTSCTGNYCYAYGGYNGGGNSRSYYNCDYYSSVVGGGGGATHIATTSGVLANLENNQDAIIIVAGGGGGANYCNYYNYAAGGSGGGYSGGTGEDKGAPDWAANGGKTAIGGTQTSGHAFGQGQSQSEDNYLIGAGGGFYGGKSTTIDGSGGGSGYVGNGSLTNKYMYGYAIPSNIWVNNYLIEKEDFLEVNGDTFNSFESAIESLGDATDATFNVIKSTDVQDVSTIPSDKNITLNLNGNKLTMTQALVNNGTLTIVDELHSNGTIENTKTNTINNKGTLVVDGVTLKSAANVIYGSSGTGTITLQNNPTLVGNRGILLESAQKAIMRSGSITASNVGVYLNASSAEFEMTTGTITAASHGINMNYTSTKVTIDDGEITSTGGYGILRDTWSTPYSTLTINGGKITGLNYGVFARYVNVTINGGEIENTSTNRDEYAIYLYSSPAEIGDNKITSQNASGLFMYGSNVSLTDSEITVKSAGGYGIRQETNTLTINGNTKIKTTGASSYGIFRYSDYDNATININNINIDSANVGVYMYSYASRCSTSFSLYNGSINAERYGIQSNSSTVSMTIGRTSDTLDQEKPYIRGKEAAVFWPSGTLYFYNGRLQGGTNITEYSGIRPNMEVVSVEIGYSENTYSALNHSDEAQATQAKEGNGYARITYLGDTVEGVCENGQVYPYNYTGAEQTLTIPCTGTYQLDVWGAQGGSSNGGYGGYSTGKIELNASDTLYINVGGQGVGTTGGYNGGGNSAGNDYYAGGGATHIATSSGLLNTLENNQEAIIIVAGGGGGGSTYSSGVHGGNGGGATGGYGGQSSEGLTGLAGGGSQTTGGRAGLGTSGNGNDGSFGKGGIGQYYSAGGGGGYYGGGSSGVNGNVAGSGGGGSGYIDNDALTDKAMYQYDLQNSSYSEFINYLARKADFLELNGNTYNSFDDAITALGEATEGTIYVIEDTTMQFTGTVPSGKNITFDLNGHELKMTQSLINEGTLTIKDGLNSNGTIDNLKTNAVVNKGTLVVDNVTIKSAANVIYGSSGTGTITLQNNPTLVGNRGILLESAQKIDMKSGSITASNVGVYLNAQSAEFKMESGSITAASHAINMNNTSTKVTIDDGEILSTGGYGILRDTWSTPYSSITINGGKITGVTYGVFARYANVTITGGEIKNTSTNRDEYALYLYSSTAIVNNAKINSPNASALYMYGTNVTMNNTEITSGAANGFGIRQESNTLTISGESKITTTGASSYGIYRYSDYDNATLNLHNVDIESSNVGIYMYSYSGRCSTTLNLRNGSVYGGTYGIQSESTTVTTNVGSLYDGPSEYEPYVEGGLYGVYISSGTANFYNGRIKGASGAYYGTIANIRPGYEIYEASAGEIDIRSQSIRTYSTENVSDEAVSTYAKSGDGSAKITYKGDYVIDSNYSTSHEKSCIDLIGKVYSYQYTGDAQEFTPECNGTYKVELWGAQGGTYNDTYHGGKGAYVSGTIDLTTTDNLYVYVGSQPANDYRQAGGYNGGGRVAENDDGRGRSGGGATDIRLVSGSWNDFESLASRIMVAGAGGGAACEGGSWCGAGGSGGGLTGNIPTSLGSNAIKYYGTGGTQTAGGTSLDGEEHYPSGLSNIGGFGYGGDSGSRDDSGSGGSGYYGGGGSSYASAGGGGSSFISGYAGCDAIDETSTEDNIIHTGQPNHYSNMVFTDGVMKDGTEEMPDYTGYSTITGNTGNGYAKITLVSLDESYDVTVHFNSSHGTISQSEKTYHYGDTIGTLETPVTSGDIVFDGWYKDIDFKTRINENYVLRSNMNVYAKFIHRSQECSLNSGDSISFSFESTEETYTIPCTGDYTLEVWGAQGGGPNGGYGGYSSGDINLAQGTTLYINVGGQGAQYDGGYNGGGQGAAGGGQWAYGGGGATHIATASGLLSTLENNKDAVIIVGAGGGGSGGSSPEAFGGNAGGYKANTGYDSVNRTYTAYNGIGATQTEPGYAYYCSSVKGSFGKGGDYCNSGYGGAGGGAGWYGGGGSNRGHGGGGGGSSYIANPNLYNKRMYGYNVSTIYESEYVREIYLVQEQNFILNGETPYSNLQTAIDRAENSDTLTFTADANISYSVTIPENKEITIDLNDHTLTTTKDITNNGTLHIIDSTINSVSNDSFEQTFEYTGTEKTFIAPSDGVYKLETWGAQGGSYDDTYHGGYGGYSTGEISLNKDEVLYINVGGKGTSAIYGNEGGYNGGGSRENVTSSDSYLGSGGGASHIATTTGLLSTLEDNKDAVIIVGAGGGGSYYYNTEYYGTGGSGGGFKGGASYVYRNGTEYHSSQATQTTGYAFGQGAPGGTYHSGGGSGYYGGKVIENCSGGGSGYIGNELLSNKSMYCYECDESSDEKTKTTSVSCAKDDPTPNCAKKGDGYVRITSVNSSKKPNSKIVNNLSNTLIINNGTLTIKDINMSNYNAIDNTTNAVLSIDNVNINSRNKAINASTGTTLTISDSNITSSGQTIVTQGHYTITDSKIIGSSYALYDNSTSENTVSNTRLQATTAVHIESTANVTMNDVEIVGNINNSKSNGILKIENTSLKDINGSISNTGTMTIKKANISYSYNEWYEYNMITNSGILTLANNDLTFTDKYSSADNYIRLINSSGTLNSTNNNYLMHRTYEYYDYRYRYPVAIYNTAILNSNNDTFTLDNGRNIYPIFNSSNNVSEVRNATFNVDKAETAYAVYNENGTLTIESSEFTSTNSTNSRGVYVNAGTVTSRDTNYHVDATTSAIGAYVNNGTFIIETGNIYAHAATAYGIQGSDTSSSGVITLGINEDNGYESTDTSQTDPYIEAIGTTTGYGISRGSGQFNFYDGKFTGTTNARTSSSITSCIERNYQVKTVPATDDNYEYCVLEFMM